MRPALAVLFAMALIGRSAAAETPARSPYAGEETRQIKSLSDKEIGELWRGEGFGFAMAAELNGVPGPAHLLELRDHLNLSVAQVAALQKILDAMKQAAVKQGEDLIAGETALDDAFKSGSISEAALGDLLARIETARRDLRFTHLSAHLKTTVLLSKDQIAAYQKLRGYADPCAGAPPAGHDPKMWREHNGCAG